MITLVRHGEPVKTAEHHSLWGITDEDKKKCAGLFAGKTFDVHLCSTLARAIQTAEAIRPDAYWMKSKLFDEIEKPIENRDLFWERVKSALGVIDRLYGDKRVLLVCHARFMNYAYNQLERGIPLGFDFLEWFEV